MFINSTRQLVAAAAQRDLVQNGNAGAVRVDAHVGLGDHHDLHARVDGVFVLAGRHAVAAPRLVFARARWLLGEEEIRRLAGAKEEKRAEVIARWRQTRACPAAARAATRRP